MRFSKVGIIGTLIAVALALMVILPVMASDGSIHGEGGVAPLVIEQGAIAPVVTGDVAQATARAGPEVAALSSVAMTATTVLRTAVGITLAGLLLLSFYLTIRWSLLARTTKDIERHGQGTARRIPESRLPSGP